MKRILIQIMSSAAAVFAFGTIANAASNAGLSAPIFLNCQNEPLGSIDVSVEKDALQATIVIPMKFRLLKAGADSKTYSSKLSDRTASHSMVLLLTLKNDFSWVELAMDASQPSQVARFTCVKN